MKNLFIINPIAGGLEKDNLPELIRDQALLRGQDFRIFTTRGDGDKTNIRNELENYRPDKIGVAGGDGTIQLVASVLLGTELQKIPLGVIPLGSANGLAKSLNLPTDTGEAVSLIYDAPNIKPIDVIRVNENHICLHLGDIGTNALLIKRYKENQDRGLMGYAKHLLASIADSEPIAFEITANHKHYSGSGYMLIFSNASHYGTGVRITEGSVTDGFFEIRIIQKIDLEEAIKAGLTILNLVVDKGMFEDVISCKEALITINPPAPLQIDGEFIGDAKEISVRIEESAIKLIFPKDES